MTEHNWRGIIIFKPSNNSYLELEIHSTNFTQQDVVPFDQTFNPMYRITPRKMDLSGQVFGKYIKDEA